VLRDACFAGSSACGASAICVKHLGLILRGAPKVGCSRDLRKQTGQSRAGAKRPTTAQRDNVTNYFSGKPYRLSKPTRWRLVHCGLTYAVRNELPIALRLRENVALDLLNAREQELIDLEDPNLNGRNDTLRRFFMGG